MKTELLTTKLDASAPRWKRQWLDLYADDGSEHGRQLEGSPPGKFAGAITWVGC